jgi:DNA-binding MarR family transcriptional regulator
LAVGWISNFKLIVVLAPVGTGAVPDAGMASSGLLKRFRAVLSSETPIAFLPDRRPSARISRPAALFLVVWASAMAASGGRIPQPQVHKDKLLPDTEVQYVCRYAARQSYGRSNGGSSPPSVAQSGRSDTSPQLETMYCFVAADRFVTLNPRYVNMADVNFSSRTASADSRPTEARAPAPREAELRWDIIELLFFAYRDFVGDADHELEAFGFGRAHHRVMHFVHRYPGLKVADLLDVLRITKQSLGRVLKQLLDEGYIVQKTGNNDRRQRLLYATPKGEALVAKLAGLQTKRINRALEDIGPAGTEAVRRFLRAMIDRDDPDKVLQTIFSTSNPKE